MAIDVGSPAVDRSTGCYDEYTKISLDNPANANGTITSIAVYCDGAPVGLRVGIFYLVSGTTYKCRSSVALSDVPSGYSEHEVSLVVEAGDYIGCYALSNTVRRDTSGYSGVLYYAGEAIDPDDEASYGTLSGDTLSLYGTGTEGGADVTIDAPCVGIDSQALASGLSLGSTLLPPLVAADSQGLLPNLARDRIFQSPLVSVDSESKVPTLSLGRTLSAPFVAIDSEALIPVIIVPGGVTIDVPLVALNSQGLTPSLALDRILNSPLIAIDGEAVAPGLTLDKILEAPTALISSEVPIHKALIGSWYSPTSHYDPDSKWQDETNAYDENTGTYATGYNNPSSWSSFLELNYSGGVLCNIVRIYMPASGYAAMAQLDVDVYYNDAWHDVYQGVSPTNAGFASYDLDGTYNVSKARVRFYNVHPFSEGFPYLYEFDFGEMVEVLIRPSTPSIDMEGLAPSLLLDKVLNAPLIEVNSELLIPTIVISEAGVGVILLRLDLRLFDLLLYSRNRALTLDERVLSFTLSERD